MKNNIDKDKIYSIDDAIKLMKENAHAKFDESVELHIRTGIDPKKGEQNVRSVCVLPHGTGKEKRIAVFTNQEKKALEAGACVAGAKELIERIKTKGEINFDVAVAEPEMMKELAQIAKILGPKGLMPSPKNETVTRDIEKTVKELKSGKITFKNDETSNVHQLIGKVSWDSLKLKENFETFLTALKRAKPSGIKGEFIKQIVLCSTMGKAVKVGVS